VGYQAGYANTTGQYNVFVGRNAGLNATTAQGNVFIGDSAGGLVTTGFANTFIGPNWSAGGASGGAITTGSKNTIIGAYTGNQGGLDIRTASNHIVLSDGDGNPRGYFKSGTGADFYLNAETGSPYAGILNFTINGSYKTQLYYDTSNSRFYVQNNSAGVYLAANGTSWTSASDERLKDIIEPITNAATKVSGLRAVIGKYKTDEEGTRRAFLIAQDVQAVLPEAVSVDTDEQKTLAVAYTEVIPLLVAAIKELKAEIDLLKGN
jgi:hypothetical protein